MSVVLEHTCCILMKIWLKTVFQTDNDVGVVIKVACLFNLNEWRWIADIVARLIWLNCNLLPTVLQALRNQSQSASPTGLLNHLTLG